MKSRLNLVLILIVILFLAAIISRNGKIALLLIPFLGYLTAALLTLPARADLSATRTISCRRAAAGSPVMVQIRLENAGARLARVELRDELLQNMLLLEGNIHQRISLPAGSQVEFNYTFQGTRGRFAWQDIRVAVSDYFGLFEQVIEIPAANQVLVLPPEIHLKRFHFHPRPTVRTAGPNLSRQPGSGIDFWGVRQYYAGDPMRLIHWRMAARHPNRFFSKEFEREEMADIGILLDGRASMNLDLADTNLFEYGVQTAAALARAFLRSGNRLSLMILGDRVTQVYPGYGKRHLAGILDKLAACEPGDMVAFDTMQYFPVKQFPPKSVIVLISPLRIRDMKTINRLKADGYQLLVVSPNPLERKVDMDDTELLAYRAARIEREIMLRRIRRMGVMVVDWQIHKSLENAMHANRGGIR
jgi:uncharacterized protein (DUF58 family)